MSLWLHFTVISFKIDFDQTYIYWSEIRFELDDESQTDEVKSIERLWFDKIHNTLKNLKILETGIVF